MPTRLPKAKNRAWIQDKRIHLVFEYDPNLIKTVKKLSSRKYLGAPTYAWTTPITVEAAKWAHDNGLKLSPMLRVWLREKLIPTKIDRSLIKKLPEGLKPFQKKGALFIESKKGRALIADEMGLGKTIQALAWFSLLYDEKPRAEKPFVVVICPTSVKLNWKIEAEKWIPGINVEVLYGMKPGVIKRDTNMVVINYHILSPWIKALKKRNPVAIIYDECHYIKNPKTQRTKAVKRMCTGTDHVIALSGTPITNRPAEAYPTLNILAPEWFPNFWEFAHDYCDAKHGRFGWDFSGASNVEQLHDILTRTVMIRRTKARVLTQLPPKVRSVILLDDLVLLRQYASEKQAVIRWFKARSKAGQSGAEALVMIEKLKQAAVRCKIKAAIRWIEYYLEIEDKLVIFAEHHETVNITMKALAAYNPVKIDGGTPAAKRESIKNTFQTKPACRVFVGTKAAKEGITLTAAKATAFLELWWTPGDHDQAEDRVHRIGQLGDSVFAYYLLAYKTIEMDVAELLDKKRQLIAQIIDGKKVQDFNLLTTLMERLLQ